MLNITRIGFFNSILTDTSDTLFLPLGHLYWSRGDLLVSFCSGLWQPCSRPSHPGPTHEKKDILDLFFLDVDVLNGSRFLLGATLGAETSALGWDGRDLSSLLRGDAQSGRLRRCCSFPGIVPRPVSSVLFWCCGSPEKAPSSWQWGTKTFPP